MIGWREPSFRPDYEIVEGCVCRVVSGYKTGWHDLPEGTFVVAEKSYGEHSAARGRTWVVYAFETPRSSMRIVDEVDLVREAGVAVRAGDGSCRLAGGMPRARPTRAGRPSSSW